MTGSRDRTVTAPEPPAWFAQAIAVRARRETVVVDGTALRLRSWGDPGAGGVLLVHGVAAHTHWWDPIAPLLARRSGRRIVAVDLAGHGDSGRRPRYDLRSWATDVLAVVRQAGLGPAPVIVGHSMGGMVALLAGAAGGEFLGGIAVIDTVVRERTPEEDARRRRRAHAPLRVYPSRERACAAFRPQPAQDAPPYALEHVARHSVRPVSGGWSWKFDPRVFDRPTLAPDDLGPVACPVTLLRAERGLLTAPIAAMVAARVGGARTAVVPRAHHHAMLDEPRALVDALVDVVAGLRAGPSAG